MKKKIEMLVTIECASDAQQMLARNSLMGTLAMLADMLTRSHKRNKVEIKELQDHAILYSRTDK